MSTPVTFRIDDADKAELDAAARELDRSPSYILSRALKSYLSYRREKISDLREAVKEADQGVFISSAAIHEWLESLDDEKPKSFPQPDILT